METVTDKPASQARSGTVQQAVPQTPAPPARPDIPPEWRLPAAHWFISMGVSLETMRDWGASDPLFALLAGAAEAGGGRS